MLLLAGCEQVWGVGAPPWYLVQVAGSAALTNHDTVTLQAASMPGDLLVVAAQSGNASSAISDDGSNSYEMAVMCERDDAENLYLWYATNTSITTTVSASLGSGALVVWEVQGVSTESLDAMGAASHEFGTTITGAQVTPSFDDDFIVSAAIVTDTALGGLGSNSLFTEDKTLAGDGYAHFASTSAVKGHSYGASWYADAGENYCSATAAFKVGP
jgi:hypothetical protein